jgi:hypothetical protein
MGLHIVSGCNKDHLRTQIHDAVADELQRKLQWMGFVSQREERGVFLLKDGTDNGRPDISIHNMPFGVGKHLLDIRVTCNLDGSQSGKIKVPSDKDASQHLLPNVQTAYNEKIREYKEKSTNVQCGFTPIIYMLTGGIHSESRKIIHKLAEHASGTIINLPSRTIYLYTMRACSVALQKGIAYAINTRILQTNSRNLASARGRFKHRTHSA